MTEPTDRATLAVVVARLDDLRDDMRAMRQELASHRADLVPRGEWEQRNRHVDARFQEQGREVASLRTELRTEIQSRRQPWTAVAGAVVAIASIALTLVLNLT